MAFVVRATSRLSRNQLVGAATMRKHFGLGSMPQLQVSGLSPKSLRIRRGQSSNMAMCFGALYNSSVRSLSSLSDSAGTPISSSDLAMGPRWGTRMRIRGERFSPTPETQANIKAFQVAKKINTMAMFQEMYGSNPNWIDSDSIILALPDDEGSHENDPQARSPTLDRFAVFFDYGAVVFLNCSNDLQRSTLAQLQRFCTGFMEVPRSDDYTFKVDPELEEWSKFESNTIQLQMLDIGNVRVIASVLGQTVALSHFEEHVDTMLETFESLNDSTSTHEFTFSSKQNNMIFQILRESNSVLADVIIKLRILDRTKMKDTAWKFEKYYKIWEGLREEFEIETRWDILSTKTEYVQHNMRFFVELLNSRKGERLEWMIIVLITAELLVSLYSLAAGMHG